MTIPHILSILFGAAGMIYIFIGIYAIYLAPRRTTNILFFVMALSLSIWSFGFSMSIAVESLSKVLFWRRFAAIGFGAFFAVMLHFFIVFTGHGFSVHRKRLYILLYLPALIVYLGFTYFPKLNPKQYNMVSTPLGWINIASHNIWDIFFAIYYIAYFTASLFLLWRWRKHSNNPGEKKTSRIIMISFFTTTVLGSITDIFGDIIFSFGIPQIAPIITVIPAVSVYYAIKKYGLLNPKYVNEDAILMSEQIRAKVSNYISIALIFASIVRFVTYFLFTENNSLRPILLSSSIFVILAAVVQLVQRFIKHKSLKDIIIAGIFALMIPVLEFRYYASAGTTIWALPFAVIIVSIMFDQRLVQLLIYGSIILTRLIMWTLVPETTVTINNSHHTIRLAIFLSAIWFADFAGRIFQNKLIENAKQIDFQKITTEISTEFISVNEQTLHKKINTALSRISTLLAPDRIYVYKLSADKNVYRLKCCGLWINDSLHNTGNMATDISDSNYPKLIERIRGGDIIAHSNIDDSVSSSGDELPRFLGSTDKAFAAMPIMIKNKVHGFLGVDCKAMVKPWSKFKLDFLKIISLIFSAAFERIQHEQEIIELAYFDHLTKLPNRFLFKDRVSQMIRLSGRTGDTLAVISLDLDTFKSINDSIGHDGGDKLIVNLAERLTKTLRQTDTVARFSGDEFLILLTNLSSVDAVSIMAEKILNIFEKPFIINGQEFFVTASAGISVYPYDGKDTDSLIRNADLAMYKSKELGKNRFMFCTDDMKEEVLYKIRLTNNLFRVLDKNELMLYYQPQVNTKSEKIIGAEALLRWFHPEYGLIMPGMFIPLAEHTGLISSIGDWVLTEACRQCKEWHLKGLHDIRMAVNVSFLQLKSPKFVSRVRQILQDTKLNPKYLELELTESTAVRNSDYILGVLNSLKEMGITISIDDFGTEYSSLSRLSTMPIDKIKLDMQFIHSIDMSEKENAIIKSVIDLSHILGLQVVAEGVETEPQLNFLKKHNNDIIQGYYFCRPVPPHDFEHKFLKD